MNIRNWLQHISTLEFTLTKRHIGILMALVGGLGALVILLRDIGGRAGGFGPSQLGGLLLACGVFLVGLSLIPLGDDPA